MRIVVLLVALTTVAVQAQTGRVESLSMAHQGRTRTAKVYIPATFKAGGPVVFSLHGRYGQADDQEKLTHFNQIADKYSFVVVYPNGYQRSWNANYGTGEAEADGIDDVGFLHALLDQVRGRYSTDSTRAYLNGMSMGGFMTHRMACESARFASFASVAGLISPQQAAACAPDGPRAFMIIHGQDDALVPYVGGETDGGGRSLSAPDTAKHWATKNGCDLGKPMVRTFRKGAVTQREYQGCQKPVALVTVSNGGHTWPGGWPGSLFYSSIVGRTNTDIDASDVIWQFAIRPLRTAQVR